MADRVPPPLYRTRWPVPPAPPNRPLSSRGVVGYLHFLAGNSAPSWEKFDPPLKNALIFHYIIFILHFALYINSFYNYAFLRTLYFIYPGKKEVRCTGVSQNPPQTRVDTCYIIFIFDLNRLKIELFRRFCLNMHVVYIC